MKANQLIVGSTCLTESHSANRRVIEEEEETRTEKKRLGQKRIDKDRKGSLLGVETGRMFGKYRAIIIKCKIANHNNI